MARVCAVRQFPYDAHLSREVAALTGAGHVVEVVCMRRPGEPWRDRRGPLTIWRVPLEHRRGGAGRYVFEHAAFVVLAATVVSLRHLRRPFALVQVNSPPDSVVAVAVVPRLLGVPLLLDLVECTPEFFATRFGTTARHPVRRLLGGVEQLAIGVADRAITGTAQMRERFVARGADPARIDVVLNASDESVFFPRPDDGGERADGSFTLVSHGSIERRYGLDTVIRALGLLRDDLPQLRLEIYGEGSEREALRQLAAQVGVTEQVSFSEGFVPIDELVAAIARADAGVVAVRRDAFRDLTHTNKMFDFVAMHRPAIVSWTRSVADYFGDDALAYFRSDDPQDLARVIAELHDDPERRARMVQRAGELYERYRGSRQRAIYLGIVDRLLAGTHG
ncbi:MAG: glycosyltransferase [Actinomycetota bacterium]|nr:glycosyltransferase [Actinomycetota bacterium]